MQLPREAERLTGGNSGPHPIVTQPSVVARASHHEIRHPIRPSTRRLASLDKLLRSRHQPVSTPIDCGSKQSRDRTQHIPRDLVETAHLSEASGKVVLLSLWKSAKEDWVVLRMVKPLMPPKTRRLTSPWASLVP